MSWSAPEIFIHATNQASVAKAHLLADKTGLPVSEEPTSGWRLQVSERALQLIRPDGVSVVIDFINGNANRRSNESNFRKQPLARALGLHKLKSADGHSIATPRVIDATAGFGTDAWMMASLGCSITLLETSQVLCALLDDAIEAAQSDDKSATIARNLTLVNTNSIDYLQNPQSAETDIVYLDPMYPTARKQALVKKGMQLLHELIGPDSNGPALLQAALTKARHRVVVKRPRGASQLEGSEEWTGQITSIDSPNTRFDVYHMATA